MSRSSSGLRVVALSTVLLLVVAACDGGADNEVQQALEDLRTAVLDINEQAGNLHDDAHALAERLESVEQLGTRLELDVARVGASRASFLPNPPEGMVTVQFLAEALDAAVPGEFEFFLAPEGTQLFDTRSLPAGQDPETGPKLEDGIAFVEPGILYMLQVVYRNPTTQTVRFLVPGGTLDPQAALPFVRNRCWCAAIPFEAPPGGTFVRAIEVGVGPDTPPGAKAVVIWPVAALEG